MKVSTGMKTIAVLLGAVPAALAASSVQGDGSQVAIYIFLGMCALIVVVQLFPLIFLLFGMVRGLMQGRKRTADIAAEVEADE